jgi:tetratricopeptide (TPR) repeat protein
VSSPAATPTPQVTKTAQETRWNALNEKAVSLYKEGKYTEAVSAGQEALRVAEENFGPEHPHVAASLSNLAAFRSAQGKSDEAEPLLKRALAIQEKALGPDNVDLAPLLNNLAELYRGQHKYAEAELLYRRSLAISEKALGPYDPDLATLLNNLSLLYMQQDKNLQAEPLLKRAVAIKEKALGPDDADVARALSNLAELYESEGKYPEATAAYKRSVNIAEKALGPAHPDLLRILSKYAGLLKKTKNEKEINDLRPLAARVLQAQAGGGPATGPQQVPERWHFNFDSRHWQLGKQAASSTQEIREYVLPGETVKNWTELVTSGFYIGSTVPPRAAFEGLAKNLKNSCPSFWSGIIEESTDSIIYEWGNRDSVSTCPAQHEIARMVRFQSGMAHLHYVKKTKQLTESERSTWLSILRTATIDSQ